MTMESDEINRLKEELRRSRDLAIQLAKLAEMGKLLAVVAHELSQPLLGIKAFAQILRRRFHNEAFIEPKVRVIEEQAILMENILDSLRQYSRMPPPGQGKVNPIEPVRSAFDLLRERAKKLRVRIGLEADEELSQVLGNRGHLQQVVVNLLSNSLEELEGKAGGRVLVRLQRVLDGVRLMVADTGEGVPQEVRGRLFEPFFTTKSGEKGTGLGLSICRDILNLYGGKIRLMEPEEVESTFGADFGAAFEVLLAKAPEEGQSRPPEMMGEISDGNRRGRSG